MQNKYVARSKISEAKFRQLVKCFALDLTATQIAELTRLNRNTVNRYLTEMRRIIRDDCLRFSPFNDGEIEVDESYFGPRRVKGKRGRGAGNKTIVFGLLKRNGRVYTHIVPDAKAETLVPIIRGHAGDEVVINTDGFRSYDGLVDMGYRKHYRVIHSQNEFARGRRHINGIESFWGFAKHRLVKFNGVKKDQFELHLKECEYRFNARGQDLYQQLLKLFRNNPLFAVEINRDL